MPEKGKSTTVNPSRTGAVPRTLIEPLLNREPVSHVSALPAIPEDDGATTGYITMVSEDEDNSAPRDVDTAKH